MSNMRSLSWFTLSAELGIPHNFLWFILQIASHDSQKRGIVTVYVGFFIHLYYLAILDSMGNLCSKLEVYPPWSILQLRFVLKRTPSFVSPINEARVRLTRFQVYICHSKQRNPFHLSACIAPSSSYATVPDNLEQLHLCKHMLYLNAI